MVKNNMARRVPRTVVNVEREFAYGDAIAVDEPAVRLKYFSVHAVFLAVFSQFVDPEPVGLVRAFDWHAQLLGEHSSLTAVIKMTVRDQDFFNRHALAFCRRLQTVKVAAGIAERALHRFGAPDQCAILLERSDRNDRGFERGLLCHGLLVGSAAKFGKVEALAAGGMYR